MEIEVKKYHLQHIEKVIWALGDYMDMRVVGNPGLLYSHTLDRVRCIQIYHRHPQSIIMDKQVFKNNMDTIENIDLENKVTHLWFGCS